jgi:hypothetical protein
MYWRRRLSTWPMSRLPAYNRGCTLNGMMNSDDAMAGKLFTPPRASAHSSFLETNGMFPILGVEMAWTDFD